MQLTLKKEKPLKPLEPKHILNLANYDKKKLSLPKFILILVLILAAVVLFAKFLVIDRFVELDRTQAEASALQSQINANYAQIRELSGVTEEYAHYTYSGMTADELALVSRVDVMDMIGRVILPYASVSSWTLQGNTLVMSVYNTTLNRLNQIVSVVNQEPIVNYSFMQSAATVNSRDEILSSEVAAQLTVYLQIPDAEATQDSEAEESPDKNSVSDVVDTVRDAFAAPDMDMYETK